MTLFSCADLDAGTCLRYVWKDYGVWIEVSIAALFVLGFLIHYRRTHGKSNLPLSTHDSFDKSGLVQVRQVENNQEGASFFSVERENGEVENHMIGQPFAFFLEGGTIERHHLNPRGAFACLDPKTMFKGYVATLNEITKVAALTEQYIRYLRTGGFEAEGHGGLRTLIILFLLAGCIGIGIAAATVHHAAGP